MGKYNDITTILETVLNTSPYVHQYAISTVTMQGSSNYLRHCTRHSDLKKITSHSNLAAILFPCHAIQNVRFLSGFLVVLLHHKQILQKNNEYLFFGTFFALITGINIMAIVNAYPQRYF